MKTTGMIGLVTEVAPKVQIKRNYAAEVDFVFSNSPDKKMVKQCAAYLENDSYESVLQFSKNTSPVRPITHFVRRLLAASSILANKELASEAEIESAKQCIQNSPQIDVVQMKNLLWGPPETIGVEFEQVFFSTDYSDMKGLLPGHKLFSEEEDVMTEIEEMMDEDEFCELLNNPQLKECVAKYSYLGAFSIMARGGFLNLLRSFVEEKPPYNDLETLTRDSKAIYSFEEIKEYLATI